MKQDILRKFTKLRASLDQERVQLQKRLRQIEAALGSKAAPKPAPGQTPAPPKLKRKLTAANKAKLIAGIKARWARYRAEKAGKAAPKSGPGRRKGKISAAGRAAIVAAQKARWAEKKGLVVPQSSGKEVMPPAKPKRKLSAAGKANIIAATKARWAKYNAEKAGKK
jgi:hypothetical protein